MKMIGTRKRQIVFTHVGTVDITWDRLTVKTVVDSINNVVSRRRSSSESAFVLLDQVLVGTCESLDVVKVSSTLVWSIRCNLSGNSGVKTRHLQVNSDIGIVNINNGTSSKKSNGFVITNGLGFRSEGSKSGNSQGGSC